MATVAKKIVMVRGLPYEPLFASVEGRRDRLATQTSPNEPTSPSQFALVNGPQTRCQNQFAPSTARASQPLKWDE